VAAPNSRSREKTVPQSQRYSREPQVLLCAFQSDCTAYFLEHLSHFHFFSPCLRQKCFLIPVRSPSARAGSWCTQMGSGHTYTRLRRGAPPAGASRGGCGPSGGAAGSGPAGTPCCRSRTRTGSWPAASWATARSPPRQDLQHRRRDRRFHDKQPAPVPQEARTTSIYRRLVVVFFYINNNNHLACRGGHASSLRAAAAAAAPRRKTTRPSSWASPPPPRILLFLCLAERSEAGWEGSKALLLASKKQSNVEHKSLLPDGSTWGASNRATGRQLLLRCGRQLLLRCVAAACGGSQLTRERNNSDGEVDVEGSLSSRDGKGIHIGLRLCLHFEFSSNAY
jgi:hypothetical protein